MCIIYDRVLSSRKKSIFQQPMQGNGKLRFYTTIMVGIGFVCFAQNKIERKRLRNNKIRVINYS